MFTGLLGLPWTLPGGHQQTRCPENSPSPLWNLSPAPCSVSASELSSPSAHPSLCLWATRPSCVSLGMQTRLTPDCSPPLINSFPGSRQALPDKVQHSHTAWAALESSSPCIPRSPPPISLTLSTASLPAMSPASQNPPTRGVSCF